jgi:hypothetical protein
MVHINKKVRNVREVIMSEIKKVTHTFLSGRLSATLIIPIDTARKYGLDRPANVVVEERQEGILIKKLEI